LIPARKSDLEKLRKDLTATTEYAPFWVILAVALALGLGTMVGWKRVVLTIGEKIGKQGMTYAQGMSRKITTALCHWLGQYLRPAGIHDPHSVFGRGRAPWSRTRAACKAAPSRPS
jgi:hypothetical protein